MSEFKNPFTIGAVLEDKARRAGLLEPEPKKKYWFGETPTNCDICGGRIGSVFYDASTQYGWAKLCHSCFTSHRCKLGVGLGQKYNTKTLEKVGG